MTTAADASGGSTTGTPVEPLFGTLPEFVDFLADTCRRVVDRQEQREQTWCPEWWRHAEAIMRLEALWRAFEHLRQDPALGMSLWFRDHVDYHLPVLLDQHRGPFRRCSTGGHAPDHDTRIPPLPCTPPPPGLFETP